MRLSRVVTAIGLVMALTSALTASGCAASPSSSGGSAIQAPAPLAPANGARDAAGAANKAVNELQSDVDSATQGK